MTLTPIYAYNKIMSILGSINIEMQIRTFIHLLFCTKLNYIIYEFVCKYYLL